MTICVIPDSAFPGWNLTVRQQYKHHCGPTSLKNLDNLIDFHAARSYGFYVDALRPSTRYGTPNAKMVAVAQQHFSHYFIAAGENVCGKKDDESFGIYNIKDRRTKQPHFVTGLGRTDDGDIIYYDPEDGAFVITPEHEMVWESGEGYKNWAMVFKKPPCAREIVDRIQIYRAAVVDQRVA